MSKELPQQQPSEDVDLGQLFRLIGHAFDKLFKFIGSIFKSIFSVFIFSLKAVINNFKIIAICLLVSGIIGYVLEKTSPKIYISQMLVKPYFDSKYQLVTNINYFNALIKEQDYKQLRALFDIDTESAASIVEFEIKPGPESENDRIVQYDRFISSIDSVRAQEISFKDYVENRSIYSGDLFEINVTSSKKDIFRSLEKGLNSSFNNTYSKKKMQKRDSILTIEKSRILNSLREVDSLKRTYMDVMADESKGQNIGSIIPSKDGFLIQEKTKTKEYELLEKQIQLRLELSTLESQKVEEDVFFDTISSFQDVGAKHKTLLMRYSIFFPLLILILLILSYLGVKIVRFANRYEA